MSLPDFIPMVSCDVGLGETYEQVDIDLEALAEYMRANGCTDDQIGETEVFFSTASVKVNLDGDPLDCIGGFFDTEAKLAVCLMGSIQQQIEDTIEKIKTDSPMSELAEHLLRHSESEFASLATLHELYHAAEVYQDTLEPSEARIDITENRRSMAAELLILRKKVGLLRLVPIGIAGGMVAESATNVLKPALEYTTVLGSLAVVGLAGVRIYGFKMANAIEDRYRKANKAYDTQPSEQRADEAAAKGCNEYYRENGRNPIRLVRKKAA